MTGEPTLGLGRHLRRAVPAARPDGRGDGELLDLFLRGADERAFEELVRRHGPMVLGVCRRVLGHADDAEDAFQAAFVVLALKGRELLGRESVGGWLHGVAYHTALKARAAAMKRREKERRAARAESATPTGEPDWLPRLDRELGRLPEKYRAAIVLCELEGRPRKEAAQALGVPEGTLSSRLAMGKKMLAERLGVPTLAVPHVTVPPALADAALKAAASAAGHLAAGAVPVAVGQLATEVVKTMFLNKLRVGLTALVVLLGVSGAGLAFLPRPSAAGDKPAAEPPAKKPAAEPPAWRKAFDQAYRLPDGVVLKRVGPPFPECRMDYYRADFAFQAKRMPHPPVMISFTQEGGVVKFRSMTVGTADSSALGVSLASVIEAVGVPRQLLVADEKVAETMVSGDWVIRTGSSLDERVLALNRILRDECKLPLRAHFKEATRDVAVAKGTVKMNPLPGRKGNQVDLYSVKPIPGSGAGGGSGTFEEFLTSVGRFTHTPVVNEAKAPPKGTFTWYNHIRGMMVKDPTNGIDTYAEDTDPAKVVANVAAQTGLTITLERRKIRVLEVVKDEPAKTGDGSP